MGSSLDSVFSVLKHSPVANMSSPSWLQPAAGRELAPDWLDPPAGQSHAPQPQPQPQSAGRSTKVAVAAAAAAAAAQAAQAASNLLSESEGTPKKTRKGTPAASAKKHAKAKSTDTLAAASVEDSSVPCSEKHSNNAEDSSVLCSEHSKDAGVADPKKTRAYTPRGTAGTFQGKRPPKSPELLKQFLKRKAAWEAEKAALRLNKKGKAKMHRRTPTQEDYQAWQSVYNRSTSACTRARFIEAASEWQKHKAEQVAEKFSFF